MFFPFFHLHVYARGFKFYRTAIVFFRYKVTKENTLINKFFSVLHFHQTHVILLLSGKVFWVSWTICMVVICDTAP